MTHYPHTIIATHRWLSLCKGFGDEPFIKSSSGTMIVPVNDAGEVLFVIEPRRVDGQPVLSLPGGGLNDDEDPADSANRELQEEIGFRANKLDFLAILNPAMRVADWMVHIYLARDLVPSKLDGDENYDITIERFPLATFEELIQSKRLMDATVISTLYMAQHFIERESAPQA